MLCEERSQAWWLTRHLSIQSLVFEPWHQNKSTKGNHESVNSIWSISISKRLFHFQRCQQVEPSPDALFTNNWLALGMPNLLIFESKSPTRICSLRLRTQRDGHFGSVLTTKKMFFFPHLLMRSGWRCAPPGPNANRFPTSAPLSLPPILVTRGGLIAPKRQRFHTEADPTHFAWRCRCGCTRSYATSGLAIKQLGREMGHSLSRYDDVMVWFQSIFYGA